MTQQAEPTKNVGRPLSKWLPVINFKGYQQKWRKEKAKKVNIPGDRGLQSGEHWLLKAQSWLGRQDWKLWTRKLLLFSYCAGTLWIEMITLWKYPPHSPSTPAKLWMCRLTPMLKGGNWILFQNSSWETKLHFPYTLFQEFESIWGQIVWAALLHFELLLVLVVGHPPAVCQQPTGIPFPTSRYISWIGKTGTSTESHLQS